MGSLFHKHHIWKGKNRTIRFETLRVNPGPTDIVYGSNTYTAFKFFFTRFVPVENLGVSVDVDLMSLEIVGVGEGLLAEVADVL